MRRHPGPATFIIFCVVSGLLSTRPALAQGNGRPKTPKAGKPVTTTSATVVATSTPVAATGTTQTATRAPESLGFGTNVRQFGSWLDDTSASTRGEGYTTVAAGHWRVSGTSQTNVPMFAAGIGVSDRMQVSASVPFYRASFDGTTVRGMDDVYVGAKYTVVDPTLSLGEVGLAVGTIVEVLSAGAPGRRVHLAFPLSVELRRAPFRVYGSAGYFTRGSIFSSGALEWTARSGLSLTGALTQSYSIAGDATLDTLSVGRQRMDVAGGVAYPLGTAAVGFVSVGRSLSRLEDGGTSLALSGGVSFRFRSGRGTP